MTIVPHDGHFDTANMLWLDVTNFCNLRCGSMITGTLYIGTLEKN